MYDLVEKSCLSIINTLYHQSLYCIILFLFITGLSFFLKNSSPRWRFWLWSLILIRLVLPTDLSLPFSARSIAGDILLTENLNLALENVSKKLVVANHIGQFSASDVTVLTEHKKVLDQTDKKSGFFLSWPFVLCAAWFSGCIVFTIIFLNKIYKFRQVLKHASLLQDKEIIGCVEYWRLSFNIKRSIRIFSSDNFLSPFTAGIIRPKIFIPEPFLENRNIDTLNSIIAHEMAHIKRFDHLWIRLQNIIQILYFFNPVVWYANRQINIARECVCDSGVMSKKVISKEAFGKSIIDALKVNVYGAPFIDALPGFGSHKKIFEYRIRDILKGNTITKQKAAFIFVIVCLLGLFLLPMSSGNTLKGDTEIKIENTITGFISEPVETFTAKPEIKDSSKEQYQEQINVSSKDTPIPVAQQTAVKEEVSIPEEPEAEKNILIIEPVKKEESSPVSLTDVSPDETEVTDKQSAPETAVPVQDEKETLILAQDIKSEVHHKKEISIADEPNTETDKAVSGTLKKQENNAASHRSSGFAYLEKHKYDKAISEFSKAIYLNPGAALCYYGRGQAYLAKNQVTNAVSDLDKTIELIPGDANLYLMRGRAHSILGKTDNAVSDYNKALEINPKLAEAYFFRGNEYSGKQKANEAISDYTRAIKIRPDYISAYVSRGYNYVSIGQFSDAFSDSQKALKLSPDNALAKELHEVLSRIYTMAGTVRNAEENGKMLMLQGREETSAKVYLESESKRALINYNNNSGN